MFQCENDITFDRMLERISNIALEDLILPNAKSELHLESGNLRNECSFQQYQRKRGNSLKLREITTTSRTSLLKTLSL